MTQAIFIFSVLLQVFLQIGTERKLRPLDHKPLEILKLLVRVGLTWIAGGTLYLGVLFATIKIAAITADQLHASAAQETAILLSGGLLGVILGFGLNFFFGPLYFKIMLPSSPLQDSELNSCISNCFTKAGFTPPKFHVIELNTLRISEVLVAGYPGGKGPFRPALFISRSILASLKTDELEAIITNQVSHISLKHLKKRLLFSLFLIITTGTLAILSVFIGQEFLISQSAIEILAPAVALSSFLSSFSFLARQARKFELEADIYSIKTMGVRFDDLCSALRKLDSPIPPEATNVHSLPKGHPETERRIELIKAHLDKEDSINPTEQSKAS